ncbi:MAG: DNA-binding protein, partial [Clostridia bacterium]|nr:DNA-binding protein [Clostridia bacterium]
MFAGCTKEEPVTTTAAPATEAGKPTEATTAAPEKIRTDIIIADTTDIKTLDPHAANDGYSARVFNQIYDPLMKQTADLEVAPALAESWEFKSDTEIIFYIRKGVKFHNGDELKASDVKFSIDRMVASPSVQSYFDKITEVT